MRSEVCGEQRRVGLSTMACVRPQHCGNPDTSSPAVEESRRRAGRIVNADRHVFVKVTRRGQ